MTTKNETRTPQVERPKFLVSIVERGKGKAIINLYNKEGVNYHYQTIGHGTATSEIMDILGLDSKDKDIVISVSTRSMIDMLVYKMSDELRGAVDTRGILFDLPVTGITNFIATALNIQLGVPADKRSQHTSTQAVYSAQLDDNNGKEVEKTMSSDQNYSLVLISVIRVIRKMSWTPQEILEPEAVQSCVPVGVAINHLHNTVSTSRQRRRLSQLLSLTTSEILSWIRSMHSMA